MFEDDLPDVPATGSTPEVVWTLSQQDILWRDAENTLVLDQRSGVLYGLRGIGVVVWHMLRRGATSFEIRNAVLDQYAGDTVRCDAAVRIFIYELATRGLISMRRPQSALDERR